MTNVEIVQLTFNFGDLDPTVRGKVEEQDRELEANLAKASGYYLQSCRNLAEIRRQLKYQRPGFKDYLKSRKISLAAAYRMIDHAERLQNLTVEDQPKALILALASDDLSEDLRQEAIESLNAGRRITEAELEERRQLDKAIKDQFAELELGDYLLTVGGVAKAIAVTSLAINCQLADGNRETYPIQHGYLEKRLDIPEESWFYESEALGKYHSSYKDFEILLATNDQGEIISLQVRSQSLEEFDQCNVIDLDRDYPGWESDLDWHVRQAKKQIDKICYEISPAINSSPEITPETPTAAPPEISQPAPPSPSGDRPLPLPHSQQLADVLDSATRLLSSHMVGSNKLVFAPMGDPNLPDRLAEIWDSYAAVAIVPVATDSKWFQAIASKPGPPQICFLPDGIAAIGFGKAVIGFSEAFHQYGSIYRAL